MKGEWEEIAGQRAERVRRLPVPGGWLYQVELFEGITNVSADLVPNSERGIGLRGGRPGPAARRVLRGVVRPAQATPDTDGYTCEFAVTVGAP